MQEWTQQGRVRVAEARPPLPAGMPFLIQIDEEGPIDFVCTAFGLEILAEQEDGYLLVASRAIDLNELEAAIVKFEAGVRGEGSAAKLYGIFGTSTRLTRILSPELLALWPSVDPSLEYVVEVSVECLGTTRPPSPIERTERDTDEKWHAKEARYTAKWNTVYQQWDEIRDRRADEVDALVKHYGGRILGMVDGVAVHALPDSFSLRIQIHGDGLKDLVQNYPFIFEASLPDDVQQPANSSGSSLATQSTRVIPPADDAPKVCVVDSGIQEQHVLLRDGVDGSTSRSFLPGDPDVADHVLPSGHGTRVAGAVLYPNGIVTGDYPLPCWIQNARVLNGNNQFPRNAFPPAVMRQVIETYSDGGTQIFVHSVSGVGASRPGYMSSWAATLDQLCADRDVLVVQAAGNLTLTGSNAQPGVTEHFVSGRRYPDYLGMRSSRIANPAQSLHALTVGSIGAASLRSDTWRTVSGAQQVSAFSRCGPGIWNSIKPEVVEYGGDYGIDEREPVRLGMPPALREAYPELVRATATGGPAYDRDECGTSFAAPKVAYIAAQVAKELRNESALHHRALLVNSARWPEAMQDGDEAANLATLRRIGFGIPDLERATASSPTRVTLFSSGVHRVKAREAHVYQVRVPESLRSVASSFPVLVEVTLAYTARPRRTRRGHRHYLSTWVDWKTSKKGESAKAFMHRVLHDVEADQDDVGSVFKWMLSDRSDTGQVPDVRRNLGTVQKDWARLAGDELPRDFCLAIVGHPGWDTHISADAPYALCVTFEVLSGSIDLHAEVEVALDELRVELGQLRIQVP